MNFLSSLIDNKTKWKFGILASSLCMCVCVWGGNLCVSVELGNIAKQKTGLLAA